VEEYRFGGEEADEPGEGWRRHIVFGVKRLRTLPNTADRTPAGHRRDPSWSGHEEGAA
jgi:hypothetical protein